MAKCQKHLNAWIGYQMMRYCVMAWIRIWSSIYFPAEVDWDTPAVGSEWRFTCRRIFRGRINFPLYAYVRSAYDNIGSLTRVYMAGWFVSCVRCNLQLKQILCGLV